MQTPCAGAYLEIEEVPAVVHCPQCGIEFAVADAGNLLCPTCGTPAVLVMQGKELMITAIEVTETEDKVIEDNEIEVKDEAVHV